MNDDFAGDQTSTGKYNIGGPAINVRSDFENDQDWLLLNRLNRYFDYHFFVYLPEEGLEPIGGVYHLTINQTDGTQVERTGRRFREISLYRHHAPTGAYFVGLQTTPQAGMDTGNFRFFAHAIDRLADDNASAQTFAPTLPGAQGITSSLNSTDDVDVIRFPMVAGTEYVFDLEGSGSFNTLQTTLGDPIFRIFSESKFEKGDNDSGDGTNARLRFTPTATGNYYLHVIGGGDSVGSYRLTSDQFDDHVNTVDENAQQVLIGGDANHGVRQYVLDFDVFKFPVVNGETYKFDLVGNDFTSVSILDATGKLVETVAKGGEYTSAADEELFVRVASAGIGAYSFSVSTADEFSDTFEGSFWPGSTRAGLQSSTDRDFIAFNYIRNARYEFEVNGVDGSEDPVIRFYDKGKNLVEGVATSQSVVRDRFGGPERSEQRWLEIFSPTGQTGLYDFRFNLRDMASGDTSTGWNVAFLDGVGQIRNALESDEDVDFHRVRLNSGVSYVMQGDVNASVVNSASEYVAGALGGDAIEFTVPATDDYYIRVRNQGVIGFDIDLFEESRISLPKANFVVRSATSTFGKVEAYERMVGSLEVWTDVPLMIDGSQVVQQQVVTLTESQWKNATLPTNLSSVGKILTRKTDRHPWATVTVVDAKPTEGLLMGTVPDLTFAFATGLPPYHAGAFEGFAMVTNEQAKMVSAGVNHFDVVANETIFNQVDPGENNNQAAMMVFQADLGADAVMAFTPGPFGGFDLVLNSNSTLFDGSFDGYGFHEVLRGIATAVGYQPNSSLTFSQSIMGTRQGGQPFPTRLMPEDILALRKARFQYGDHYGNEATSYNLVQDESFLRSITDREGTVFPLRVVDVVSAEGATVGASINLQRGSASSLRQDGKSFTYVNSFYTLLNDGIGGEGNDGLTGNEADNVLEGRGGIDVLRGEAGDDTLMGGVGSDYYRYMPGHGNDVIDETDGDGIDVLRLEGMTGLDRLNSITNDLTFDRLGNDLVIRLELDGQPNALAESITIRNMGNVNSRVEALTMLQANGTAVARISLASVWDQATDARTRFALAGGNDAFGALVTPV